MTARASFKDRVALVTGASGGIGLAICRELAEREARIAIAYGRNAAPAVELARELERDGVRAVALAADLSQADAPAQLVADVEASLGEVDLLVANHGVGRRTEYDEVDAASFDRTLAINLRAPFLLTQRVLPGMRRRRFGRVLFTSSTAAFRGGVLAPDYAASKAGLHGLVYYLADRVAADGVTVNAIAPGLVETAMLPVDASQLASAVPVKRLGRADEVAAFAVAVLENGYLTNHVLSIDGGMHPR
jgi:3-oxoacyl-[acyl-carrier protein] reductase